MTREHHPEPHPHDAGDYEPRHGADRGPEATVTAPAELVARVADRAPSKEVAEQICQSFARHGAAYAVYLSFADTDPYSTETEASFRNVYVHTYRDRDGLIDDTIDAFGWQQHLDRRLETDPLLRAVVTFDRQAIWGFANDHYKIVDTDAGLHVFEQDP